MYNSFDYRYMQCYVEVQSHDYSVVEEQNVTKGLTYQYTISTVFEVLSSGHNIIGIVLVCGISIYFAVGLDTGSPPVVGCQRPWKGKQR